jgi:hypothetical protein
VWRPECEKAGLDPSRGEEPPAPPPPDDLEAFGPPDVAALAAAPFQEDGAAANGSSIALILEYEGRRVLLASDAHPFDLVAAVHRLRPDGSRLPLGTCKLAHHGSKRNVSRDLPRGRAEADEHPRDVRIHP